jgi:hypothetical protein
MELALACGSASISNTFFSKTPKEAARFTDVVVFQLLLLISNCFAHLLYKF